MGWTTLTTGSRRKMETGAIEADDRAVILKPSMPGRMRTTYLEAEGTAMRVLGNRLPAKQLKGRHRWPYVQQRRWR